jgi:hypothetical protein
MVHSAHAEEETWQEEARQEKARQPEKGKPPGETNSA